MIDIGFYVASAVALFATTMVITNTNPVHALLYLVVSLLAIAVVFFTLGAPFAGVLEVIIYAGAIMVLFLFVIMMTERGEPGRRRAVVPAAILTGALAVELWLSARAAPSAAAGPRAGGTETSSLGALLLGRYLFAFEIASLLILAALVGAIALAGKKKESR